ncbi:MAG TPA: DUF5076 domain-containing protein [Gemmatimonadaceae bacterium]|nr:DUF5076 domain-containing protein [Gemmatimonadaceae bacterium]
MSATHPHQLALPQELLDDPNARELARVWFSEERQTLLIDARVIDEPAAWGLFALDLMKHAARAYAQQGGISKEDAYKRMLAMFAAEMKNPTEPL